MRGKTIGAESKAWTGHGYCGGGASTEHKESSKKKIKLEMALIDNISIPVSFTRLY